MHTGLRYLWVTWLSISLALVLSSCGAYEGKTTPPPTPVPQTPAPPRTSPSTLRVGIAPNYPPLAFKQQGHLAGLEVDFARGLEGELGRPVALVELAWDALIPALESGTIDVIMSGMSITEARAQRAWFVSHYLRVGQMAMFRKADNLLLSSPTLLTLTDKRVGFVDGTTGAAYVHAHLPKAQYVPLGSTDTGLQALRAGDIDVFVHDAVTAWYLADDEANAMLTSSFFPLTEEYLAWAVRRTDEALHRDLEAVLERWRRSGRLQELFNTWLRFRVG
jgi:polar amino acid transport system substrate-binding protein